MTDPSDPPDPSDPSDPREAPDSGVTVRFAAVLSSPARPLDVPPGIDPGEFRLALLEDTYEVVAGLELVTAALVLDPPDQPDA
ncbi:MAG: hypothetical protein ACRDNL_22935, partial [Spirillospora sp.]